jgi:hypothetical protein
MNSVDKKTERFRTELPDHFDVLSTAVAAFAGDEES